MRQTSSGQLGGYVVLSLVVHLVSIVWVLRSLDVVSPTAPQPEAIRVTVVAPNLPGSPVPHAASRASTLAASISRIETLPLALSRPAALMVANVGTPEAPPAAPAALEPPLKATPKPQLERLTIPAQIPELATPATSQAAPRPAPAQTAASIPTVVPPAAATPIHTAAPTAPLAPQATPPPPPTPAPQRQRPAVAPVSSPPPSVRALPTIPSLRADAASKRFPSPAAPSEASSQPLRTTRPLAPPPSVDATAPSPLPAQQSTAPKPRQEVAVAPQLAKPSDGPSFPAPSGQGQQSASAPGQSASDFVPHFTYKPCPRYPYMARNRGAEGVVALRAELLANGMIGRVNVVKSSGYASLDSAARKAVQKWTHDPSSNGSQLPRWGDVSVNFKLTRSKDSNGHDHAKTPPHLNCDPPR